MTTRLARTLSAVAFLIVCGLISTVSVASFTFLDQTGARVNIEGQISSSYSPTYCPVLQYATATGGDGRLTESDSNSLALLGGTQTSTATADAPSATVHVLAAAANGTCVLPSPTGPSSITMVASANAFAELYDTYTVSSTDPSRTGSSVTVTVEWRINGSFSALVPQRPDGSDYGNVQFQVDGGNTYIVRSFVSSQVTHVYETGKETFTAVVGDTFKVAVHLRAVADTSLVADFSGSAVAFSDDQDVVVTGVAHTGGLAPLILGPLPDGVVGQAYSATLGSAFGAAPYAWSLAATSAPLPSGLNLSPSGLITGTPTIAGTFPVTVQVTDGSVPSQSDTHTFPLRIFPVSLSAFGTPTTIDGVLGVGEWDNAACQDTVVNVPGGGTTPARLCAMNDATNLYVALRFDRAFLDPGNSLGVEFDNDNDGQAENGDDVYVFNPDVGFIDDFRTDIPPCPAGNGAATCGLRDVDDGGTNNGSGALVNNGTVSIYETSHPLNSGDVGHDFALAPGDAVGFWFFLRMIQPGNQFPQDFGDTYYPNARFYGRIIIASMNAPTPAGSNVVVAPADAATGQTPVTLTLDQVTQAGTTSVTSSPSGSPPPAGFQVGNPPLYYEITTTAVFAGDVTVCVSYAGVSFSGQPELYHIVNGVPVPVPGYLDTVNEIVCGRVSSLSPFAVFARQDTTRPVTTATETPGANAGGWNNSNVIITLNATDNEPGGSGVEAIHFSLTGAQTGNQIVSGNAASVTISAEGTTTLAYFAVDRAGNQERAKTLTVRIDRTPPAVTCTVSPSALWPANHQMVPVASVVTVTDAGSGAAGFTLTSVASSEPDLGVGDGDRPNDIQGFAIGEAGRSGQLRAERSGLGRGRLYTLTYTGRDVAGNSATCAATAIVPHDQRR